MSNSGDPDETARHEPSHLDLHCLQRYLIWSAGIGGFSPYHFSPKILTAITEHLFCFYIQLILVTSNTDSNYY